MISEQAIRLNAPVMFVVGGSAEAWGLPNFYNYFCHRARYHLWNNITKAQLFSPGSSPGPEMMVCSGVPFITSAVKREHDKCHFAQANGKSSMACSEFCRHCVQLMEAASG